MVKVMSEFMVNALEVTKIPAYLKVMETDATYPAINQFLGKLHDVHYYLHSNRLYFAGDEKEVERELVQANFKADFKGTLEVDLRANWEITRNILYKAIRFFLLNKNFVWKPRIKNEVFITSPMSYKGIDLVQTFVNFNLDKMFIHEGFRFYFDFIKGKLYFLLVPSMTPLLPIKELRLPGELVTVCRKECQKREMCKLPKRKILVQTVQTFHSISNFCPLTDYYVELFGTKQVIVPYWSLHYEARPTTIHSMGFKLPKKRNFEIRNILHAFSNILSDNKSEILIPVGKAEDGLVIDSNYLIIGKEEVDFYD
jgi:hypothetical protein